MMAMSFLGLIAKNLIRQPIRAVLTLVGITLGIATVVALGVITAGLNETAGGFVRSGGADFMIGQEGAADTSLSAVPEERIDAVAGIDGVDEAYGVFFHVLTAGSNPFFFLMGIDDEVLAAHPPVLVDGRLRDATDADDAIVLGEAAAKDLGVGVGSEVELAGRTFTVVGVFSSEVIWEAGGAYAPLDLVQEVAARPETVTVGYVHAEPGADPVALAARVEEELAGIVSISDAGDYGKIDQGFELVNAANVAISFLAVVLGGIGVMNTMVMSIFERTREIGVLRAIGWSGGRVLRMVLMESVLLCLVAVVVGIGVGVGLSRVATGMSAVSGLVVPAYPPSVFVQAALIGVLVGLAGAIYPAVRASLLLPVEALRYE
jgi:putative ABC transport system permease protein